MNHRFRICKPADGPRRPLGVQPRLESWEKRGARSQIAPTHFLDHLDAILAEDLESHRARLP